MAVKTPIAPGIIARVAAGVRYAVTGKDVNGWFSPLAPIAPVVPQSQMESVEGRQFDYPVGYNTRITPRQDEAVSFRQMRALADGYDLLRLVIETRKDQVAKMKWTIRPVDDDKTPDARCDNLVEFFRFPDRENNWDDWLRMLMEELFVTDAASIYVRPTLGGQPFSFEIIDGGTITRKLDVLGRTPIAPDTAYQQVLHGVPAVDYTSDELIYQPRNKRAHKVYGYSPVEQIIMTVNIALRRQIHKLQYYTDGSAPDLIFSVPDSWNPDQMRKFKQYWDEMLAGNTANRRGTMFVPNGTSVINTKESALKDEYDDWLARIVCYAFSVPPTPFIKQNNKATAESAATSAEQEGLTPIQQWIKGVIDKIIVKYFGYADLRFDWVEDVAVDPLVQAQVNQIYITTEVKTPDEVRAEIGLEPLTPEAREAAFPTPAPPVQLFQPQAASDPVKPKDDGAATKHEHIHKDDDIDPKKKAHPH
jgi:HK97 family phage portal protein